MKKVYEIPKVEVVYFESEDIIATSANPDIGEGEDEF